MNGLEGAEIIKVIDGRTKELKEDFRQKMLDSGEMISMDEIIYEEGRMTGRLNDCLKKWKNFPKNRYLINVLCQYFHYNCEEDRKLKLFEEQESGGPLSKSSEDVLSDLTDCLTDQIGKIDDNDIRRELEQKYTWEMIRDNLLDLKEDFFLEFLAPVCDMDAFTVMMFMVRVFERDELSNYRTNEFLLNMAMMIHEQYEMDSTLEILYRLKACYDSAVPAEVSEEVPEQEGTRYIAEKSEFELKDEREAFRTEDYPQLQEVMSWYKAAVKPLNRNRAEAYSALFDEVMQLYSDKMDDFLRVVAQEEVTGVKRWCRENFKVPVTVWYDNSHSTESVWIKGGTKFKGENCEYSVGKPVELPPEDYVQMCVHIIPDPDNSKLPRQRTQAVKAGAEFTILKGNEQRDGRPVIQNVRTATLSTVKKAENTENAAPKTKLDSSLWTKPKWTREDYEESPYTGFVVMDVMVGEPIPKDLCFEYKGFKFAPIIEKGIEGPCYSKKTVLAGLDVDGIGVNIIKTERKKVKVKGRTETKKFYVLEGTEKITQMKPMPDVVRKISNLSNRVTVSEDQVEVVGDSLVVRTDQVEGREILEEREREDGSGQKLFSRYMYGEEDYLMVSGLDIKQARETGLDLRNLSSDWLTESKIPESPQQFAELSEYRQRSVLLVLLFLKYIEIGKELMRTKRERFIRNFRGFISKQMGEYRFDELYMGYPIDCLLQFLLGTCISEDICDILRVIYKENERQRQKEN